MFLPIGDAPNPEGTPFVTYALVAVNVAVFLMWNVPLGSRHADVNDPAFGEYVEVMTRELSGRVAGLVDDSHGSAADLAEDLVAADRRRSLRHGHPAA